ncbi:hypothetical protein Syun_029347 [Stephania yunnanensis]|uniref:STAS domain-containing protein n=1 Tax=Stephania yunnanensis TaxID=152371 RepID=A0AAP0HFY0_9MAGN
MVAMEHQNPTISQPSSSLLLLRPSMQNGEGERRRLRWPKQGTEYIYMGNLDFAYPVAAGEKTGQRVVVPAPRPFVESLKGSLKETFFPDDPIRQFKGQPLSRKLVLGLQYFLPILEWAPRYTFQYFKADLVAGITIASLAIPQGISYAKLANLPPILGLLEMGKWCFGLLLPLLPHPHKIGHLKKGLNPPSLTDLAFGSQYLTTAIKTGIVTGVIALAEGIAVGRSFAMFKNYHIDGNKEMIAIGTMNIVGSCTSCYLTTVEWTCRAIFAVAVNFNAGCKTAVSNIVMAIAVMLTLLFLTPLFHYTPLVVLSSIIIAAMLGLIDYDAAIHLWKVDKFDFVVCISAYVGVVFGSVEIGLVIAVALSVLRVLLVIARPRTHVLGNIPNSMIYRNVDHYPVANNVPGVFILQIDSPIYFANASYLRERISRWIDEEEERIKSSVETSLQYVILDMSAVSSIDTSGISLIDEVKKNVERRGQQLVLANPGSEVMKKLDKSKMMEEIGQEWIYLTVAEAVGACNFMLHTCKANSNADNIV